jgi:hypothetical protein
MDHTPETAPKSTPYDQLSPYQKTVLNLLYSIAARQSKSVQLDVNFNPDKQVRSMLNSYIEENPSC